MTEHFLQSIDHNGVLSLTLNRPRVHNALSDEMIAGLAQLFDTVSDDISVRAIVISGAGESFCAGADLNGMRGKPAARNNAEKSVEKFEEEAQRLAQMLRRLNYCSKPTIARINGPAYGGGVGLLSCCDITIAASHARFALTEVRLGLVPAVISPYVFRCMGELHARRYFLNGQRFDAAQAQQIGLVQEIAPADELDQAVQRQLDLLLRAGPQAVKQAKKLVFSVAGHDASRQRQSDQENARLIARMRLSDEGQEGMSAFLEKRNPAWVPQSDE